MEITLEFKALNISIQKTDIVYACTTVDGQAGVNHPSASTNTKPFPIGEVKSVNHANGRL